MEAKPMIVIQSTRPLQTKKASKSIKSFLESEFEMAPNSYANEDVVEKLKTIVQELEASCKGETSPLSLVKTEGIEPSAKNKAKKSKKDKRKAGELNVSSTPKKRIKKEKLTKWCVSHALLIPFYT